MAIYIAGWIQLRIWYIFQNSTPCLSPLSVFIKFWIKLIIWYQSSFGPWTPVGKLMLNSATKSMRLWLGTRPALINSMQPYKLFSLNYRPFVPPNVHKSFLLTSTHSHRNLLPIEQPAPLLLLVLITHIHYNSSCISQSSTEKTQLVGFIELNNTLSFRTLELHNAYS